MTLEIREEEPLARHSYYRIGGPARRLAIPGSVAELGEALALARADGAPVLVLGLGSNVLVSDRGWPGWVIKTSRLDLSIERVGERGLRTGASVALSSLLRRAAAEGWGGLARLAGIPGSVGGAVWMNAGTHLGEAGALLLEVEAIDAAPGAAPGVRRFARDELAFEYRAQRFLGTSWIVTAATWEIDPSAVPAEVARELDEVLARRKATQPLDAPSCGSVFKNPPGGRAWEVIERLGLRGHRAGAAQFSAKHPNFIVNLGGARAADVHDLILLARSRARAELGIELEPEVRLVGEF